MSVAGAISAAGGLISSALQAIGGGGVVSAMTVPQCARAGAGKDGIAIVRNWPGKWKNTEHAKNVKACFDQGLLGPWRWIAVQADPRLVVYVMHDALSIGTNPHCRIPINQSGCQRLADWIGAQIGAKLLMPTPKIVDAVHLAAVQSGRAIDQVSIWNDPTEPVSPASGMVENQGQNVEQWLRQQKRISDATKVAGGYPSSGALSTVGKDVTLSPAVTDHAVANDTSGEAKGAKMEIYGWHTKAKPGGDIKAPHLSAALAAVGWHGVHQGESTVHVDFDAGSTGHGGFWDYSSIVRFVLDACLLDGQPASLSAIYQSQPEIAYAFRGAPKRPVPSRYPLVPAPAP